MKRREFITLAAGLVGSAVLSACGVKSSGGGGQSSGGGSSGGGGGGGGGSTTVYAATTSQASVNTNNNWQSTFGAPLVTAVSASQGAVSGDLNFNPWQSMGATQAPINRGQSFSWTRVGAGSGSTVSLTA